MTSSRHDWSNVGAAMRDELHFGSRVVRCFLERPRSIYQLLADAAARHPDGEALVCGAERLTWRRLEARVMVVAAGLARAGLGAGDRIALLAGNHIENVVALYAIARIGAVAVPLNTRMQAPEIAYAVTDCGARMLIHDADLADRLPARRDVPSLAYLTRIGSEPARPDERPPPGLPPPARVGEDDTAVILYTSGTTGRPKGAMLSHLGIVHSALVYVHCMGLRQSDRSIVAVPLSHVTGLVAEVAAFTLIAGTLIVMPAFKADAFLALAVAERMTHTLMVPAMYNLCLLQPDVARLDLSRWRIGGYGGAPMPVPTIDTLTELAPGLALINAYGATETTSPAVLMPPTATRGHADKVGQPVPGAVIRIMDDGGRELPSGEVGEVWIAGPAVVAGYWGNPEATAREIVGGFWRSGDLGSIDADGHLAVLDRKKDMINRGGYKIYTAEVETVLAAHPQVVESAVIARPCPVLGERVHAVVMARVPGLDAGTLRAHCAAVLSDYKVPETYDIRHEPLPRNAGGKVLKRELRLGGG